MVGWDLGHGSTVQKLIWEAECGLPWLEYWLHMATCGVVGGTTEEVTVSHIKERLEIHSGPNL